MLCALGSIAAAERRQPAAGGAGPPPGVPAFHEGAVLRRMRALGHAALSERRTGVATAMLPTAGAVLAAADATYDFAG
ncbi:hypothetical protein [Streptomyces sp. NPDC018693]|uniref:hypothetical protein n=1 Tax=unclassified Streptomyces TaxID=2593676 RepID=UPI0037AA3811